MPSLSQIGLPTCSTQTWPCNTKAIPVCFHFTRQALKLGKFHIPHPKSRFPTLSDIFYAFFGAEFWPNHCCCRPSISSLSTVKSALLAGCLLTGDRELARTHASFFSHAKILANIPKQMECGRWPGSTCALEKFSAKLTIS